MKKLISSVFITGLMYYLPLWNHSNLISSYKLLFPVICSLWLLNKQRELDWQAIKKNASTDQYSTIAIVLIGIVSQILPIVEWSIKSNAQHEGLTMIPFTGILMLFGGLFLRLDSIEVLGKFFTNEVQVGAGWKLIKTGTYKYIRHPTYLGAFMTLLGTSLLFEAYLSLLFSAFCLITVYIFRIYLEEKTLQSHFGDIYLEYKKSTWAFIPFLW